MRRNPNAYLRDAIDAARRVAEKMRSTELSEFEQDDDLRSIVFFKLQIVGEALNHYSALEPQLAESITDIDKIIATRNIIVHGYYQLRLEIIHHIATVETLGSLRSCRS